MKNFIFSILCLCTSSCIFESNFKILDKNFKVGFIEFEENRNLFFKSEGVFREGYLDSIWLNEEYILTKLLLEDNDTTECFILINKTYYATNYFKLDNDVFDTLPNSRAYSLIRTKRFINFSW